MVRLVESQVRLLDEVSMIELQSRIYTFNFKKDGKIPRGRL